MLLYVQVKPNQRFNGIEYHDNKWIIRLCAPAVDGKANQALVEYLSEVLGLSKSKIVLTKGQSARIKCLSIEAGEEIVRQHLENALK